MLINGLCSEKNGGYNPIKIMLRNKNYLCYLQKYLISRAFTLLCNSRAMTSHFDIFKNKFKQKHI